MSAAKKKKKAVPKCVLRPSLTGTERAPAALGDVLYERWRGRSRSIDNDCDLTMDGWRREAQETLDALEHRGFYLMSKPEPRKSR